MDGLKPSGFWGSDVLGKEVSIMEVRWSNHFRKQYARLSHDTQQIIQRALARFDRPGQTLRLQRNPQYYELRCGSQWRVVWYYDSPHVIVLHAVGEHDHVLSRL